MSPDEVLFKLENAKRLKKLMKAVKKLGGECEIKFSDENKIDISISFEKSNKKASNKSEAQQIGFHP